MINANTCARPLRIVHSESSCGWGGQEIRILGESEGMIRRGHDVRILCPAQAPIYEAARRRNIPAEALPIERRTVKALAAVRQWMKANRFDVINTHSSADTWLFAVAAKILGPKAPVVRTRHISVTPGRDPLTRWLYTRGADMIVTTGERLRQSLISNSRVPPDHLISIPTGIDTERFVPADPLEPRGKLGLPLDRTIVGVVATLRHGKGHDCLIDAFHQLARGDLHLLIVGDGKMRPAIDAQIESLGMAGQVTLTGNQEDVVPWLQAMDLFTLPTYANEGVPQCIMQAMSCGLPVVATTAGSIDEAVADGETGLIVPQRDAAALADAMKTLLDDAALRRRFAAEGRRVAVERFGVDRMLDRMEDVFRQFVAES